MVSNLTKSSFRIYIDDPTKYLTGISWESSTPVGMTSEIIRTSNGRDRYLMSAKPEPKPITLSKAANPEEDLLVDTWLRNFCTADPVIPGLTESSALLMIVPLKPCMTAEAYPQKIKVYNIIPTDWSLWDADVLNTTDVSRVEMVLAWTNYQLS